MKHGTITEFLRLVERTPQLAREFGELAAKYDFRFVREELSDEQLDDVSGGVMPAASKGGGLCLGFPDCCYTPDDPDAYAPSPYPSTDVSGGTKTGSTKVGPGTKPASPDASPALDVGIARGPTG